MAGNDKIGFDSLTKAPISPRYRAVILGASGEVVGMVKLKADDDPTALVQAQALVDGHAVELWDGIHYIEHFPPVN